MNETFLLHGVVFTWDGRKARTNAAKHGITFEAAAEAFFDPFLQVVDASSSEESRDAIIGYDAVGRLLFVIHAALLEDRNPNDLSPSRESGGAEDL